MTFKTVLAAVDGSAQATKTVAVAADVAKRYGAKLVVLHVVPPIFEGRERDQLAKLAHMEHMERTEYEMLQERGKVVVDAAELEARKRGVRSVESLVEVGDPAHVIVNTSRTQGADLIVLGRRGLGIPKELLLGSVSHKVIQVSDTPCLIVSQIAVRSFFGERVPHYIVA